MGLMNATSGDNEFIDKLMQARRHDGVPGTSAQENMLIRRGRRGHDHSASPANLCSSCGDHIGSTSGVLPDGRRLCSDCLTTYLDQLMPQSPGKAPCVPSSKRNAGQTTRCKYDHTRASKGEEPRVEPHLKLAGRLVASFLAICVVGFPVWRSHTRLLWYGTNTLRLCAAAAFTRH